MSGITGAFSNLEISERTICEDSASRNMKLPKNHSTMSLPNLSSERIQISPSFIRNNFSDICDDDSGDQPIDFSKKYCETKLNSKLKLGKSDRNCSFKSFNNSFTMYAETDLDQPTDYSLRYAENDSDSNQCSKIPKTETTEYVQDTIKTYCTEDTPYETPFTFSTSTSMSDLRIDNKLDSKPVDKEPIVHQSKIKSEFSSGLMSPEKPVNYCDEGTPRYLSRVPSCGSLNSIPKQEVKENLEEEKSKTSLRSSKFPGESKAVKFEDVVNYAEETPLMFSRSSSLASLDSIEQHSIHDDRSSVVSDFSRLTSGLISPSELPDSPSQTVPPSPKSRQKPLTFPVLHKKKGEDLAQPVEALPKSSVFEDVVKKFKMENTPLHFSAATSLSSLLDPDDIDQQVKEEKVKDEIVDGLNELDINDNDLSESSEDEGILAACINIGMQNNKYCQPKASTPPPNNDALSTYKIEHAEINVVGDSLRTYCTEDTPAVLSHAGSNSDLSVLSLPTKNRSFALEGNDLCEEDEPQLIDAKIDEEKNETDASRPPSSADDALLEECIMTGSPLKIAKEEINQIEESDDDADILEDCINIGMKNNRYTHQKLVKPNVVTDTVRSYYTEDTPAILSHAGSHSDLSILSLNGTDCLTESDDERLLEECVQFGIAQIAAKAGKSKEDELSDPDSDSALLQKCIQAGMPKKPLRPQNASFDLTSAESILDKNLAQGGPSRSQKSMDLNETEQALLQQCILAGMQPKTRNKTKVAKEEVIEIGESDDDDDLLEDCINIGIKNNKYTHQKLVKPNVVNDTVRSRFSESEDERLLEECVQFGIAKIAAKAGKSKGDELSDADSALLQKYIQAGMPQKPSRPQDLRESMELNEAEKALLQQCILAGMPPKTRKKTTSLSGAKEEVMEIGESDDDDDLLEDCINIGIKNNKYTHQKLVKPNMVNDTERSCFSESDDERLLEECVQFGIAQIAAKARKSKGDELSDSDSDSALLQKCIQAGMPRKPSRPQDASFDLTPAEKAMLQQCILAGMNKCRSAPRKQEEDTAELTDAEQALLRQCILSGMPKNKNLAQGGPSRSKEWMVISAAERALLQQCILAGMPPKTRNKTTSSSGGRQWMRRSREERVEPEHTCCVHCPRNNQNKGVVAKQVKSKRRKEKGQVRESRELYITSQILAMRREVVERVREEWV